MRFLRVASAAALIALGVTGCASQAGYLAKQGRYLLQYSTGTKSIDAMLASADTASATRRFLATVRDVKAYAVRELGLRDNANYTRYKAIDRDHLVDVVSAAASDSFTPYLWSYPFLGRLPYKGFYERADADGEAARLRGEGWDVIVRPVDAFSTLGFTKDPVYSFMETYPVYELASTIIHEQTHATLFLKGQPDFNEELATFVGNEGGFQWLRARYGEDSTEYRAAVDQAADQATFVAQLQALSRSLSDVYAGPASKEEKVAAKAAAIRDFNDRFQRDKAALFRTDGYRAIGPLPLNNAYLSLYSLYEDDLPLLRSYWSAVCGSSIRTFMDKARELSKHGDVKAQMRAALPAG
jgi:predicted aminopeptidase